MPSLAQSSVLVTGCSRGLGLGFVKHMLGLPNTNAPKHIFATCRSLKADNTKELSKLAEKNPHLHLFELDVADVSGQRLPEIVEQVKDVSADCGLSLLINNAGITIHESFYNVTVESVRKCFDVNTIAPLMVTKAFFPLLKFTAEEPTLPTPTVVNISSSLGSIQGTSGSQFVLPYRISKAALNIVTKSLSIDLAKYGILSYALYPGWVQTNIGGKYAPLTVERSVSHLLKLIESLDETKNGCFIKYDGTTVPW